MIDKWIYKFFSALDKFVLFVDNLVQRMNEINMNYYFTHDDLLIDVNISTSSYIFVFLDLKYFF